MRPIVEKRNYEIFVSECKKLCTFIKSVAGRKIAALSKIKYDHARIEY